MKPRWRVLTLGLSGTMLSLVPSGCDSPPGTTVQIASVDHDLARGSTGPEVAALTGYLKTYGYFPNAELQSQYPAWRPMVASAPSDSEVFDANVEQALKSFQKTMNLKQTGVFDAGTRAVVALPRCGVPDGIEQLDTSDKWAADWLSGNSIPPAITWWLSNTDGDLTTAAINNDITNMETLWQQYSAYTFQHRQTTPMVTVSFANLGSNTNALTTGSISLNNVSVQLNSVKNWTDNGAPNTNQIDLPSVVLHQLGHALGLEHSAYSSAAMYPSFGNNQVKRTLGTDDVEAIAAVSPVWTSLGTPPPGAAVRAVSNAHVNGPSIWALSGTTAGGYQIWEMDGGWYQHPGGAVRIAVNPTSNGNQPWVINDQNQVFRWNWSIQNWDYIPACATDIGIGTDDSVWVIGCTAIDGGYQIFKYNGDAACGSGNCWTMSDGAGTQVSVGPATPTSSVPVPWVINSYGVFTRGSADPTASGTWSQLPGLPNGKTPLGIAAAAGYGFVHSLGTFGYNVFAYNYQPASGSPPSDGNPPAPAENQWFPVSQDPWPAGLAPAGAFPIMVGTAGVIYQLH
jgi:peptidoglycan hydrolase-like protein with peptidoglycan-binding domain